MRKILLITGLLLIIGLTISSQKIETKDVKIPVENVLIDTTTDAEEELVVEDWMTQPFNFNS